MDTDTTEYPPPPADLDKVQARYHAAVAALTDTSHIRCAVPKAVEDAVDDSSRLALELAHLRARTRAPIQAAEEYAACTSGAIEHPSGASRRFDALIDAQEDARQLIPRMTPLTPAPALPALALRRL